MEFNFNSFGNSKQSISYCEVDKCKAVVDLKQQLNQLKAQLEAYKMESEEGKEINAELKAENEELKEKVASYICSTNCYKYKEVEELKADNKHLNGLLDQALKELEEHRELKDEDSLRVTQLATECSHLSRMNENLKSMFYNTLNLEAGEMENLFKCKQAIEKVREIAESQIKAEENNKYKTNGYIVAFDILQICDEVNE